VSSAFSPLQLLNALSAFVLVFPFTPKAPRLGCRGKPGHDDRAELLALVACEERLDFGGAGHAGYVEAGVDVVDFTGDACRQLT
jgi:hypothetical protein